MTKIRLSVGWGIIIFLSIIPILLWFFVPKSNPPFSNISTTSSSLGEIFGLVGIVMFAINLILSAGISPVERLFGDLNNLYQKHSILGQLSFILLLFHPLLLIPRYVPNTTEVGAFLFFSNNWARNWGILALGIMIVLITLTLYLRPKYNTWKATHKLFGFVFFLAALHAYLIPSYIMNSAILRGYILGFAALGLTAFLYKTVIKYILRGI